MPNKLLQNHTQIGKTPLHDSSVFKTAENGLFSEAGGDDLLSCLRFLFLFLNEESSYLFFLFALGLEYCLLFLLLLPF